MTKRSKNGQRPTTDLQESLIVEGLLKGMTQKEIGLMVTDRTGKKTNRDVVRRVIKKQTELWHTTKDDGFDYHMQLELDRLRVMEREAWRQYEACGGVIQQEETRRLFDADDELINHSVKTITKDDPARAHEWFKTILKIQGDRRKLLKLEQSITFNAQMITMKAYAGWNPDNAWPDPPQLDANVIEGDAVE